MILTAFHRPFSPKNKCSNFYVKINRPSNQNAMPVKKKHFTIVADEQWAWSARKGNEHAQALIPTVNLSVEKKRTEKNGVVCKLMHIVTVIQSISPKHENNKRPSVVAGNLNIWPHLPSLCITTLGSFSSVSVSIFFAPCSMAKGNILRTAYALVSVIILNRAHKIRVPLKKGLSDAHE